MLVQIPQMEDLTTQQTLVHNDRHQLILLHEVLAMQKGGKKNYCALVRLGW
jgi:hypothetical protein